MMSASREQACDRQLETASEAALEKAAAPSKTSLVPADLRARAARTPPPPVHRHEPTALRRGSEGGCEGASLSSRTGPTCSPPRDHDADTTPRTLVHPPRTLVHYACHACIYCLPADHPMPSI
jgi:hypothetical protein